MKSLLAGRIISRRLVLRVLISRGQRTNPMEEEAKAARHPKGLHDHPLAEVRVLGVHIVEDFLGRDRHDLLYLMQFAIIATRRATLQGIAGQPRQLVTIAVSMDISSMIV